MTSPVLSVGLVIRACNNCLAIHEGGIRARSRHRPPAAMSPHEASLPHTNPQLPPIQPEHFTFFPAMAIIFFSAYMAAAIGWIVLFALKRSGVHRLSDMQSPTERE